MEYELGKWDLSSLAPNYETPSFEKKLEEIHKRTCEFEDKRTLLRNDIDSEDFYLIMNLFETLVENLSLLEHYCHLLFTEDTSNANVRSLVSRVKEFHAKTANRTLFFTLWWKKDIDEKNAQRLASDAGQLRNYLLREREIAKYTLSEPEEKIINIKDTTGVSFIEKLYDQYTERFVFNISVDGKKRKVLKTRLVSFFNSPDASKRRAAYRSLLKVYSENEDILHELYRNVVLNWKNEAIDLRGYKSPISVRNILNDIPDESVDSLLNVCRKNNTIFQRFFKQKEKILGMKKMSRYHIYAPIDLKEREYPFSEAVKLVLNSFRQLSPKIASLALKVLQEKHLDSEIRKGKRGGAFCATASPRITPFVLLNYNSKLNDVLTLAHELGHAIHGLLANDKSILVQNAPLPLAEIASVFSEMLLMENLSERSPAEEERGFLVRFLDETYATIMRQAYFTIFEVKAHKLIGEGGTAEKVDRLYYNNLNEQFGNAVSLPKTFRHEWTYIPHFYHTPFYTYAYAFGNLLAISLYTKYREDNTFVSDYVKLLSTGGSRKPESILKEVDVDIRSPQFWQTGFEFINKKTRYLERMDF